MQAGSPATLPFAQVYASIDPRSHQSPDLGKIPPRLLPHVWPHLERSLQGAPIIAVQIRFEMMQPMVNC